MNFRAMLLCGALSAVTLPAADTLTEQFQRALFEEEANRNLPAAIAGYEAVVKRLDEQRQLAATAVFRMGESYRKLGKTNEAVSAYERIILEFADQETLVKLSGQNLSILKPRESDSPATTDAELSRLLDRRIQMQANLQQLRNQFTEDHALVRQANRDVRILDLQIQLRKSGGGNQPDGVAGPAPYGAVDSMHQEYLRLKSTLEQLKQSSSRDELKTLVQMLLPDANFTKLDEMEVAARIELAGYKAEFGPEYGAVTTSQAKVDSISQTIDERIAGAIKAAEIKLAALEQIVTAQSGSTSQMIAPLDPATRARQKELLEQEIALVELQVREDDVRAGMGNISTADRIKRQRELLVLRRRLAALEPTPQAVTDQKQLIGEELMLVDQLVASARLMLEAGRGSRDDLVALEREQLQLRRELVDLDRPSAAAKDSGSAVSTMTAEEAEELRRVQGLVANSPDLINAPGKDGFPPLHQAIQNGHVHVFRYLLDHGADVNNQRGTSSSPMHTAAASGQLVILDELLGRSANPSLRDSEGNTPLHRAARLGFVAVAEKLLKAGVDIDAVRGAGSSADEQTPLQLAMAMRQAAMVQLLIAKGAKVSLQSGQLNPPLFLALARVPQFIDTLLEAGANPNGTNTSGASVLHRAIQRAGSVARQRRGESSEQGITPAVLEADWLATTSKLLDKGANVNAGLAPSAQAPQGESPLFAAVGTRSAELMALLLERGADPNLSVGFGPALVTAGSGSTVGGGSTLQPVLQLAAVPGGLRLVELLLKHGADPNARSQAGDTSLIKAAFYGQGDIAAALLKAGADPNLTDGLGQTPLAIVTLRLAEFADQPTFVTQGTTRRAAQSAVVGGAAANRPRDLRDPVEDWLALIRLLLAHGAKPDLPMSNEDSTRPLHQAAARHQELVRLLIEAKASVAATNRFGNTPLHAAASANRPEAVRLLVAAGADLNAADIKGNTPLHLAIAQDSLEAARTLLELGADKSVANKDGHSPERIAIAFPTSVPVFDGVLPNYEPSATRSPRPLRTPSQRRVFDLFKAE